MLVPSVVYMQWRISVHDVDVVSRVLEGKLSSHRKRARVRFACLLPQLLRAALLPLTAQRSRSGVVRREGACVRVRSSSLRAF